MYHHSPEALRARNARRTLRILLLAKHARSDGALDPVDGNHAVYHHELRTTLENLGYLVTAANNYDALYERPDVDFVIPLLNRAGFTHSEMLAPLLLTRAGIPFLGAAPIIRGLTDNKHLTKIVARSHGVPTADWKFFPRTSTDTAPPPFAREGKLVVKPNASSASWGVKVCDDWREAIDHVRWLHERAHDALVERWHPLIDIAVPVIGGETGKPWILPPMAYQPEDPTRVRSYEEKRGLVPTDALDPLFPVEDPGLVQRLKDAVAPLLREFWPFDYGRFEFRFDPATGAIAFIEVNLSCNLWSKKTISRSARLVGLSHEQLVDTIVRHSLGRQRVIAAPQPLAVY
ncbi:phosphoribosylglycinamide synthetase [Erythrobacter sp. NE805]|uniref:phosphoribosylglycinamide synthetase n=1 Tax=Erythrobacter sp. NE805 TaxID=3389875 RepID=UPI00396B28A9